MVTPDTGIDSEDRAVNELAHAIERYVSAQPQAVDTVDGICRWWLSEFAPVPPKLAEVAVRYLVGKGVLQEIRGLDGHVRYGATMPPVSR
jgi:hypothetical protein